jgi:hypothetical protein
MHYSPGAVAIRRDVLALVISLLVLACRAPSASLPSVPLGSPVAFVIDRTPTNGEPRQELAGVVTPNGNSLEIVVTKGTLTRRSARWRLLDIRAVLATGDTARGASTPIKSQSIAVSRLPLTSDGVVSDTIRFVLTPGRLDLAKHWLAFEIHGMLMTEDGRIFEALRWIHGTATPLIKSQ